MKHLGTLGIRGFAALCLAVLIASNGAFLLIRLGDYALPKSRVAENLRAAFARGDVTTNDYPVSQMAGIDQYSDCVSFQLALLGNSGPIRNALEPRRLPDDRHRCLDLKKYLDGTIGGDQGSTYTRFWHGSASLVAAALTVLPVDGYRALLLNTTLALIGLSAVLAALNGLPMLLGIAPLLVLSFLLDGQFGYGQLVSHAPTQIASWAMAAFLIGWQSRLTTRKIILLAILLGCVQSFFDLLINVPLPASIFLVVATAVSLPRWRSQPFSVAASGSVGFGLAWGFGFLGSCVAKLALTAAVLGWGAVISPFIEQLRFRTGLVDPEKGLAVEDHASWVGMIGRNVYNLGANFWRLGYTDGRPNVVSAIIAVIALVGWGWAACRIIRALRRHHIRVMLINGTGYVAASLLVLAWVAVFPEHTWRHAFFMVRSAMIWIAGGWGWALTDYAAGRCWKRRTPAGESAQGKVT